VKTFTLEQMRENAKQREALLSEKRSRAWEQDKKDRLVAGETLLQAERVSVRRKFSVGLGWLFLYRFDSSSPTGVILGVNILDNEAGRELVKRYGYDIRPANSLFG